jgi:cbb3-type cytochrome oxidase subunit 3
MYQKILCDMDGIGLYGVISICIFFGFFTGMLLWAFALKKNHLNNMGNLPLDDGSRPQASTAKTPSSTKL